MINTAKNMIKQAISFNFPSVYIEDVVFEEDGGWFRDLTYSKEFEDIDDRERFAEEANCLKFAKMVPGYEVWRDDKNYFSFGKVNTY